jgi:hypothetical protein
MQVTDPLQDLIKCFHESPQPSLKVTNYFQIYADLFAYLRDTECTFIETGVLNGGSLFMWKKWLGKHARIIGIDLNPAAKKWADFGFEIYIGDQGDPEFWRKTFKEIGHFDALLDDGGHQSFQQIVTLSEAIRAAKNKCIIAIEDTCTSFMKQFAAHQNHSFLEYAKVSTDNLLAKTNHFFENEFTEFGNQKSVDLFASVYSIQFFSGIVAYKVNPESLERPELVWNHLPETMEPDFRYKGTSSARVNWPNPLSEQEVFILGGNNNHA